MKYGNWIIAAAVIGAAALLLGLFAETASDKRQEADHDAHGGHDEHEAETGPNGGRLLRDDDFAVEVAVFERGGPPELRLYAYQDGESLDPASVDAEVVLERLGGARDTFGFTAEDDYLRGNSTVREPHSFDVTVAVSHAGQSYRWQYENHEGRTRISARAAETSAIRVERAGARTIAEVVELTGTVETDPARISVIRPRFAGVVTAVRGTVGDYVQRGDPLATVEANESLMHIPVTAPINGLIVERSAQPGQVTGEEPLFVIADPDVVWAQLDVFEKQAGQIRQGQPVELTTLDGRRVPAEIDWVSPVMAHGSQSLKARVVVANSDLKLHPGQFVKARVLVHEAEVPLAVRLSAVQRYRDFDVVFARVGEVYEVRMLELGRQDSEYVEVLGGLEQGEDYVAENSYLIKADIEKAGASHSH